jgi:hypothetical protein
MGKKKSSDDSDGGGELIATPHPHVRCVAFRFVFIVMLTIICGALGQSSHSHSFIHSFIYLIHILQDVLCGRGGLTNQHTGNEWFRRLVRSNRPLYRSCPKHTKLLVAKAIVQAVQQQEPSGRFLEVADRNEGLWRQISYKRAVDKTSQALREKDPPMPQDGDANFNANAMPAMDPPLQLPDDSIQSEAAEAAAKAAARKGKRKEEDLTDLAQATLKQAGFIGDNNQNKVTPASAILPPQVDLGKKRKPPRKQEFIKPSWWGRSAPVDVNVDVNVNVDQMDNHNDNHNDSAANRPAKKLKPEDPLVPPPPEPLQTRQSSLFRFLSNTSIFGGADQQQQQQQQLPQQQQQQQQQQPLQQQPSNSVFSFSSGMNMNINNNSRNPGDMISQEAAGFQGSGNRPNPRMSFTMQGPPPPDPALQQMSSTFLLDPLPISGPQQQQQQEQQLQNAFGSQQKQQQQQQQQRQNSFESQPDQIQQMQRQMQDRMQQMQEHMQQQMQMQMEQLRRASFENQTNANPMMKNGSNNNNHNHNHNANANAMMNNNNSNHNNNLPRNSLRTSLLDDPNGVFSNGVRDNPQAAFQNNPMAAASVPQQQGDHAPPPVNRLSSQVSDWLTSFFPLGKEGNEAEQPPPPPPAMENLERSVSSTLINFARSPSNFLTSLRSGVSGLFGENNDNNNNNNATLATTALLSQDENTAMAAALPSFNPAAAAGMPSSSNNKGPVIGTASHGMSLLDDYEESPLETRLRTGVPG